MAQPSLKISCSQIADCWQITINSLVGKATSGTVAGIEKLWHHRSMRNRLLQRWVFVISMVAMFGALVAMPLTSTSAVAMAGNADSLAQTSSSTMDAMPCHKATKPCPHCPYKFCADMGNCIAKCFQILSLPVADACLQGAIASSVLLPEPSQLVAGSLVQPLLRPPSV